jgi:hypothetical protein
MPRHQTHRGLAPKDERLFSTRHLPALRAAVADLCWLLDHGYALRSSAELVGNRHNLVARQRMAVIRCACSGDDGERRQAHHLDPSCIAGRELWLDGYNVLTLLESALAGGIVLLGRDGCYRDIAGLHRHYRKVNETIPVLGMVGEFAETAKVAWCRWWLDKPVSNSGRLKALILDVAARANWNMSVDLAFNPDGVLAKCEHIVATSDSAILDRCGAWVNLTRTIIARRIPDARVVDLSNV